jgi:ketosteroid isomerase-like protein
MRRTLLSCALIACLAHSAAALDEPDRQAIRGIIERQIDAFRRDDAAGAFAFATPALQTLFGTKERFMSMVQQGYKPVYRQRSVTFTELRDTPAGPAQSVLLQDENGAQWLAVYTLERQPDGTWKIAGCTLERDPGQPV